MWGDFRNESDPQNIDLAPSKQNRRVVVLLIDAMLVRRLHVEDRSGIHEICEDTVSIEYQSMVKINE